MKMANNTVKYVDWYGEHTLIDTGIDLDPLKHEYAGANKTGYVYWDGKHTYVRPYHMYSSHRKRLYRTVTKEAWHGSGKGI